MHDTIAFGTVLAAILAGILLNRSDYRELRDKIDALRSEMHGLNSQMHTKIDSLRGEMHDEFERFYMTLGQHDARVANLEKR